MLKEIIKDFVSTYGCKSCNETEEYMQIDIQSDLGLDGIDIVVGSDKEPMWFINVYGNGDISYASESMSYTYETEEQMTMDGESKEITSKIIMAIYQKLKNK